MGLRGAVRLNDQEDRARQGGLPEPANDAVEVEQGGGVGLGRGRLRTHRGGLRGARTSTNKVATYSSSCEASGKSARGRGRHRTSRPPAPRTRSRQDGSW